MTEDRRDWDAGSGSTTKFVEPCAISGSATVTFPSP